jgi:hypothetical protein
VLQHTAMYENSICHQFRDVALGGSSKLEGPEIERSTSAAAMHGFCYLAKI